MDSDDEDTGGWECSGKCIFGFLKALWSFSKISILILVVISAWVWTSKQRVINIEVLSQLCRQRNFPFVMTFHHDRLLNRQSFDSTTKVKDLSPRQKEILVEMKNGSRGHFPEGPLRTINPTEIYNATTKSYVTVTETRNLTSYTYSKPNMLANGTQSGWTLPNGTVTKEFHALPQPIFRKNNFDAFKIIFHNETWDKTFILIFTLTIAWSSWHNDDHDHEHKEDRDENFGHVKSIHWKKKGSDHHDHTHMHITGYHR